MARRGRRRAGGRALTPRERDVALLLAQGCGREQVAVALGVSHRTVSGYLRAIGAKIGLGPKDRVGQDRLAAAAARALRQRGA